MTPRVQTKKTMWDEATVAKAKELWAQGLSYRKIGEILGTTRCAVSGLLHRHGLKRTQLYDPTNIHRVYKAHTRPERKKMEPTPIIPEPASDANITLLSSSTFHCRWPLDAIDGEPMICGAQKKPGNPYCPFHAAKAIQPSQPRRDSEQQMNWKSRI